MVDVVLGTFCGDEGKGKMVDFISNDTDMCIRCTGGANASHTICYNDVRYSLHLVPSSIFHSNVKSIIGCGVVINLLELTLEIKYLKDLGVDLSNLYISDKAHIILPYHEAVDEVYEKLRKKKIGSSKSGIAPCISDKYQKSGIRIEDLYNGLLFDKLKDTLKVKNKFLKCYGYDEINFDSLYNEIISYSEIIKEYVYDTTLIIHNGVKNNEKIICEGAQGSLLDADYGNYPYVTSSNPSIGGICLGAGIGPKYIDEVYGVVKMYSSRGREGIFVTEQDNRIGEVIRKLGYEYDATTKKPRRCGWLDLVALNYVITLNGITGLMITHLDTIGKFKKIKICTSYIHDGIIDDSYSATYSYLNKCSAHYEEFDCDFNINGIKKREDLPSNALKILNRIEKVTGIPIKFISTGPNHDDVICC